MSDLKSVAQHAVECAKKYGAQDASAKIDRAKSTDISWRKEQIENIESAVTSELVLELFVDGRKGNFRSSDVRHESVEAFIRDAVSMTRLLEADPAAMLPDPSLYANRANIDLELYDSSITQLTPNDLVEMSVNLEAECKKFSDLDIFDISSGARMSLYEYYHVNTNGFEGAAQKSRVSGGCSITVTDGDKKTSGSEGHSARFISDLRKPELIAAKAAQNCRYRIGAKKISSKVRTILVDRDVTNFLWYYLSPLNGYSFINKDTIYLDKIGKMIGSPLVDIHDKPFIKRGDNSQLFDSDGISTKELTIIDHGRLETIHLDMYCANKLKMKATGSRTNVVFTPGKRSLNEMISDIKDGIYVLDLAGGNADPTTGDYSFGIYGVAIENGKLTQNVCEMNISGNMLELWNNLTEVGNDPCDDTSFWMPSLRFDNVSTSGN